MKIYINQIPDTGLELSETCEPSSLDLNRPDIRLTEPINISGQISKGPDFISVKLAIEISMRLNCSRCLEEFTVPKSLETKLNLLIENRDAIDLTDNLREEIMLNFPLKPLCRPECRGLCPICGWNLNKGKCKCQPRGEKNGSS